MFHGVCRHFLSDNTAGDLPSQNQPYYDADEYHLRVMVPLTHMQQFLW